MVPRNRRKNEGACTLIRSMHQPREKGKKTHTHKKERARRGMGGGVFDAGWRFPSRKKESETRGREGATLNGACSDASWRFSSQKKNSYPSRRKGRGVAGGVPYGLAFSSRKGRAKFKKERARCLYRGVPCGLAFCLLDRKRNSTERGRDVDGGVRCRLAFPAREGSKKEGEAIYGGGCSMRFGVCFREGK